jgi:transposase
MMSKTRREFAPEFKREAVALLENNGGPLTQVASESGIQPSMLRAWRRMMQGGDVRPRP